MGNEAKKTFVQLLKYGVIGVSNTLITLVVFYVINTLMGLDYAVANTLGYILGLINSFVSNRTWVFRTGGNVWREAGLFALGFIICFALQMGVSQWLLSTSLHDLTISWLPMKNTGENVIMCLSMVVYTLANYVYNRFVTFKKIADEEG